MRRVQRCQVRREVRCQGQVDQSQGDLRFCQVRFRQMRRVRGQEVISLMESRRCQADNVGPRSMTASKSLQRHWRGLSDAQLACAVRDARRSVAAFTRATSSSGSLLQSWIRGKSVIEFDHYPPNDIIDQRRGSQFYYHSHRDGDSEHGHLHLFWHATASGRRRYLRAAQARWTRTAPTHLFAISLDARGLPVGLFTVNRWVTDGHWFDAATTTSMVDQFAVGQVKGHKHSCEWLTGFVSLYRPLIAQLIEQRDKRVARRPDREATLLDQRLEVLSLLTIDWAADLDALEAHASRRGI